CPNRSRPSCRRCFRTRSSSTASAPPRPDIKAPHFPAPPAAASPWTRPRRCWATISSPSSPARARSGGWRGAAACRSVITRIRKKRRRRSAARAASAGGRWVIPGDLATLAADGSITILGRGAVCINSGGEKIFPEEVEEALKAHEGVLDAVVVGVPDERWGQQVAALVQARPGREIDAQIL